MIPDIPDPPTLPPEEKPMGEIMGMPARLKLELDAGKGRTITLPIGDITQYVGGSGWHELRIALSPTFLGRVHEARKHFLWKFSS